MGIEASRADALATFVQNLTPSDVERWTKRISTVLKIWRRTAVAIKFTRRYYTHAVYALMLTWMAIDTRARCFPLRRI